MHKLNKIKQKTNKIKIQKMINNKKKKLNKINRLDNKRNNNLNLNNY